MSCGPGGPLLIAAVSLATFGCESTTEPLPTFEPGIQTDGRVFYRWPRSGQIRISRWNPARCFLTGLRIVRGR